jgi:hypothetical protein
VEEGGIRRVDGERTEPGPAFTAANRWILTLTQVLYEWSFRSAGRCHVLNMPM